MFDKFMYTFFGKIDDLFMKIDIMFEKIWKTFTTKHKRGRKK